MQTTDVWHQDKNICGAITEFLDWPQADASAASTDFYI